MRAIQMAKTGGPEVLEYVEMPKPELNAGQVLVRVHAIGVGKPDVLVRTGVYKWMPPLPTTPGIEATGHIAALGAGVEGLRVDEPVFVYPWKTRGCYAEYVAAQASDVTRSRRSRSGRCCDAFKLHRCESDTSRRTTRPQPPNTIRERSGRWRW